MAPGHDFRRKRRHRRSYYGKTRRKRGLTVGSSLLLWGAIACLCLLLSLWAGTIARFTSSLPRGGDEYAHADHKSLRGVGQELPAHEAGAVAPVTTGSGGVTKKHKDGSPSLSVGLGEEQRDHQGPTKRTPALLRTVLVGVDFKGGDLQDVGPLTVKGKEACRRLCAKDGRCLKWTLQEENMLCWLKGAGGLRKDKMPGVTSGIVRKVEDKSIKPPNYSNGVPPAPVQCCPEGAGVPPPGVHGLDLWDDQPGSDWTTSYALGNGHLGAMLGMGTFKDKLYMSDGRLWAGKGKSAGDSGFGFPESPDRYEAFEQAREALLNGDPKTAQEAAGRMPTKPSGFVGSFEYAGELLLDFGGAIVGGVGVGGGGQTAPERGRDGKEHDVEDYIRHLHLNNGTAEASFGSVDPTSLWWPGKSERGVRRLHHREAFASKVDGVLAMRLTCEEDGGRRGCLSLLATTERQGRSHSTEAWQLPPPTFRLEEDVTGGEGGSNQNAGRGAYLGLFRPPGDAKAAMGFHMCVAVIPSSEGGGAGAVAETFHDVKPPPDQEPPGARHANKGVDAAILAARIADVPGAAHQGLLNSAGRKEASPLGPRHRVYLSADDEHKEALVLVSIVTEGERREGEEDSFRSPDGAPPQTKQTRATRWAAGAPAAGNATGGKTRGNEHGRGVESDHVGQVEGEGGKGGDQHERNGGEEGEQLRRRCLEKVEAAAVLGFEELRRRHVNDVEALFTRVDFSLGPSSEGDGEPEQGVTARPSSCVAGLPIRTRVSRSGMACTARGEEESDADYSSDGGEELATSEDTESIVVDDGLIELMYHFGRYLMISGSRPGGKPLNLQGIWANSLEAKWQGDYHMNINLQMAYWGAHAAGLPECAEPLVPFVEALSEGGQQTAQSYYRAAGWVAHANTDRWGGTAAHGDAVWALCPTCGAWMALHLWEAYEYTRDPSLLLRSVVPVLEGSVSFFLDYMVLADDGQGDGVCLLTGPSTSPENSLPGFRNILTAARNVAMPTPSVPGLDAVDVPPPLADLSEGMSQAGQGKREGEGRRVQGKPAPKSRPPKYLFPFASMSPAMDVSIVRQLLENFIDASREAASLLLLLPAEGLTSRLPDSWTPQDAPRLFDPPGAWQEQSAASSADPKSAASSSASSVSERLLRLSERSAEALSLLPNRGRPVVGRDGLLREYRGVDTSELPDPGHRHWSGLWALYPGSQIASGENQKIFQAAAATVHYKVDHGGGHTAWSRAWLVNLRARLFQGTEALSSLRGLMREQCVGSLYSLHPALTRSSDKKLEDCSSCFEWDGEDKGRSPSAKKPQKPTRRESGLVTADGAAFQIDGNLGVLAGVNEMLLQSHYRRSSIKGINQGDDEKPRYSGPPKAPTIDIRMLPALPEEWPAGRFRGLRTRGGYEVDVEWEAGKVREATIRLVAGFSNEDRGAVPRCRVISRSQLFVDGEGVNGGSLHRETVVDTVYEGGVLWHSVALEALQPGEEVRFVAADFRD